MKRSEIRKALEAWFDVERYEAIEKLTLQQFYVLRLSGASWLTECC